MADCSGAETLEIEKQLDAAIFKECGGCGDTDGPLYRVNPKGRPGIFMCFDCHPDPDSIDKNLMEVVEIIGKM